MKFKLWLDDVRPAPPGYIHFYDAQTLIDFCDYIKLANIHEISLDHDLGHANAKTGYDFLKWVENEVATNTQHVPAFKIHSANPVGRKNMEAAIANINKFAW